MNTRLVLLWAVSVALGTPALAADLYIDASNGSDFANGLSWGTAKQSIQGGLAAAALLDGPDVLHIAEGTYRSVQELGSISLVSDVTLRGGYPQGGGRRDLALHETRVEADFGEAFLLLDVAGVTLDGLSIRGRNARGITILHSSDIALRNLVLQGNALEGWCAAVPQLGSESCRPLGSGPVSGAAILAENTNGLSLENCLIASSEVGFVNLTSDPSCNPQMCRVRMSGSALHLTGSGRLQNVTVAGSRGAPEAVSLSSGFEVIDSIFSQNENLDYAGPSPSFSLVDEGLFDGWNVVGFDPGFASGPEGDFYLSPDSLAIDAGSRSAADAGLDSSTTLASQAADSGRVDLGFHYPVSSSSRPAIRLREDFRRLLEDDAGERRRIRR